MGNVYFLMGNEAVLSFPFQQGREATLYRTLSEVSRATCNERGARSSPRNLATSAEREVPRATCNEREARSSPRNLATSAKREVPRATLQRARSAKFPARPCNEREARSSPRHLQRARSAKFPAQETMFPFIFTKNRVIYSFVNDI